MRTQYLNAEIVLEPDDYFFVRPGRAGTVQIILTSGNGKPVKISGVSRRQVYGLLAQAQRILLHQQEAEAEAVLKEARPEDISGGHAPI